MTKTVRRLNPVADLLLLHIELKWINLAIWPRIALPELGKLRRVIQGVMGWR